MPRWGPCQCGHMGPPLMVMGTMVMVVENHFPAAFRHQLDVFIFRASVTAHSIKPICDQHKMQVGQCCVRERHLAINSYHLFWAKSFITNPLPHNSSAAEPQNTSTPHTHTFHTLIYVFIYWSHSHHWALHDAFEEDEVQVIGSCGTCAVTQCVQGLMHGYTNIKNRKKTENTQKKENRVYLTLLLCYLPLLPMGNRLNSSPQRQREHIYSSSYFICEWKKSGGKVSRREEGRRERRSSLTSFPKQFHLCQSLCS